MFMRHFGQTPFCPVFRQLRQVLVVLSAVFAIGCGGGGKQDGDSVQSPPGAGPQSTAVENVPVPASSSANPTPSVPAADTGLQLPDQALPIEDEKDSGPTKPGAGGLEMPDLDPSPNPDESTSSTTAGGGPALQFASWSAIESHAKSTGKITVVDLWSTACEPCIKEFPGLVRLSKAMPQDVSCIGVSVDYDGRKSRPPEHYSEKVGSFLTAVGADFDNYVCNTPSDDVYAAVGLPSIPAVLIFDASGKLVKQFVDAGDTAGFSYETDVIPFVEKLAG